MHSVNKKHFLIRFTIDLQLLNLYAIIFYHFQFYHEYYHLLHFGRIFVIFCVRKLKSQNLQAQAQSPFSYLLHKIFVDISWISIFLFHNRTLIVLNKALLLNRNSYVNKLLQYIENYDLQYIHCALSLNLIFVYNNNHQ